MKNFNIFYLNFQKTIALISGVLVLSIAVGYMVFAFNEPGSSPPDILPADNIYELINVGSGSQTKTGNLTVSTLTVSDGHLYLNTDGSGGDIERADYIKGHNDLHLLSDTGAPTAASIYLDKNEEEIEFYTQETQRMKIDGNGDVHIFGFQDCFLMANNDGKLMCYSGGAMPIGKEFQSAQAEILRVGKSGSDSLTLIEEEGVIIGGEGIIKITTNVSARCREEWERFQLYINGEEKEQLTANGYTVCISWNWGSCVKSECRTDTKSRTWYYHVKQGDVVKITTSGSNDLYTSGSASVYNLTFQRDTVEYVSSDGVILYYYDINNTGRMGKVFQRFEPTAPVSMAVTADGIPIKIVVQE